MLQDFGLNEEERASQPFRHWICKHCQTIDLIDGLPNSRISTYLCWYALPRLKMATSIKNGHFGLHWALREKFLVSKREYSAHSWMNTRSGLYYLHRRVVSDVDLVGR